LPLFAVLSYVTVQGFNPPEFGFCVYQTAARPDYQEAVLQIVGTLLLVGIASLIAVPFGVLSRRLFVSFSKGSMARWVRFATNVLEFRLCGGVFCLRFVQ
jgi:phosphate transport system permease protein